MSPSNKDGLPEPIAAFSNTYAQLPVHFFARQNPVRVASPHLVKFNVALAKELGLDIDAVEAEEAAALFAGSVIPVGAEPIAMAYAGHQFGNFVPQLGDGRAILLGEVLDQNGIRRDIQLKGAGRTPFSRSGDGRAALGPVLREYLVSEAMHALGVPTTRALAVTTTGEIVQRECLLPGAVLTRVAASHVRVGTFQYFAAHGDESAVKCLADYVIDRHYPAAKETENPYFTLLDSVIDRQAFLIARWMQVGFIHGVMNTDNMAVSGETIDFGPCAFMDAYDPATVFSAIDQFGRYAYGNQPHIAQWNLARLAETLLPFLDARPERGVEIAGELVSGFSARFESYWLVGMRSKLGLYTEEEGDRELVQTLLNIMHKNAADFTLTFRRLCDAAETEDADGDLHALFAGPGGIENWVTSWRLRLTRESAAPPVRALSMRQVNPAFIPRNHRVEYALTAAVGNSDFQAFDELLGVLARPYEDQQALMFYADVPRPDERVFRTYCGT
ncbi:MAG: YdiU family protein [Alphaproteobacteria bacterium]